MKRLFFLTLAKLEILLEDRYRHMSAKAKARALKIWYWVFQREWIDFENPRNFNQKMQCMKLHDSTPEKERLSDKYRVREWVKETIGEQYLIPLLGAWSSEKDIDFAALPDRFVLKANHGSGMNAVVLDKQGIDEDELRKTAGKWLRTPSGILSLEQQYFGIRRMVLAEQYIEQPDGELLDYKIHCFRGVPRFIQIIGNRKNNAHDKHKIKEAYLDMSWRPIEGMHNRYSLYEETPEKPACLDALVGIAQRLSASFEYVRVDLYVVGDSIKFGEMTFTPAQGLGKWARCIPDEWWK